MQFTNLKSRSIYSTWFCIFFFLLLMMYLGFIEFFQDSRIEVSATELLKNPVKSEFLKNVESMRFKNRIGQFLIKKESDSWILQEPRVMPANTKTINSLIEALKDIKVHTIHEHETINLQSFSLDNPTIQIDLFHKNSAKITIKVGIINPIDNTSYITVSGRNHIYQVNIMKEKLNKLELSDFIDSNIFSITANEIKSFELYRGKESKAFNSLSQVNDIWTAQKYNTISSESTFEKISKILGIKTHMIIDKQDEELSNFIGNYIENPLYRIKITKNNDQIVEYKISTLIKAIKDLKIEKRQYFLMTASDRKYPYVINKSYLNDFIIKYSDLRK